MTELAGDYSEKSVMRFIVSEAKNPSSMLTSIARAREIARTVRDILPREVWEQINELYLYVGEHAAEAAAKRTRYAFLSHVTQRMQTLTGMFEGIFSDGDALSFLTLGRNIERADMTSRIVDVRAAAMIEAGDEEELLPFESVLWMSVLRSLSGYQMYRLQTRERVHGAGVVRFLLADDHFPRACVCCLRRAEETLAPPAQQPAAAAAAGADAPRRAPHSLRGAGAGRAARLHRSAAAVAGAHRP